MILLKPKNLFKLNKFTKINNYNFNNILKTGNRHSSQSLLQFSP